MRSAARGTTLTISLMQLLAGAGEQDALAPVSDRVAAFGERLDMRRKTHASYCFWGLLLSCGRDNQMAEFEGCGSRFRTRQVGLAVIG
jgi:hypothetical protein